VHPVTAVPPSATSVDAGRARTAFARYRVMAFVTGGMLLLLTLEMVLKYVVHAAGVDEGGEPRAVLGTWIAFAHGWVYVVYLVTVFDLWSRMRWQAGRMLVMVAAGVVPVLSFVVEPRAAGWVDRDLARTAG
jgi:integral membrane protein